MLVGGAFIFNTERRSMRFGCCINMVASELDGIGTEHLSELEHMGYDYVEMPLAEMMRLDGPNFLELKRRVDRLTIGCEVCNNFFSILRLIISGELRTKSFSNSPVK